MTKVRINNQDYYTTGDMWGTLDILQSLKSKGKARMIVSCPPIWQVELLDKDSWAILKNILPASSWDTIESNLDFGEQTQDLKISLLIEESKEKFPKLYNFQHEAVATMVAGGLNYMLCDEMGLGKTYESIAAAKMYSDPPYVVVCPNSLKIQWEEMIEELCPDDDICVIQGMNKKQRIEAIEDPYTEWLIINYEILRYHTEDLANRDTNVVILDEATRAKNSETATYKSLSSILEGNNAAVIGVTGTPLENSLSDTFSIASLSRPGFMSKFQFHRVYVKWKRKKIGKRTYRVINGYRNIAEFKNTIRNFYIRRKKTDVDIELPALMVQNREISDDPLQRVAAESLIKWSQTEGRGLLSVISTLRTLQDDLYLINTSESNMAATLKDLVPGILKYKDAMCPKIDELRSICEEARGQKIIIFSEFSKMADEIASQLDQRGFMVSSVDGSTNMADRYEAIEHLREGQSDILVSTDIFTHGANLQFADILINFDSPWNPAKLRQRIDRIHRIGGKGSKLVINLIGSSIDQYVWEVISGKVGLFKAVTDDDLEVGVDKAILSKLTEVYG